MTHVTRRTFVLSGAASMIALAGCSVTGTGQYQSSGTEKIDARVDKTLAQMYAEYPKTRAIAARSSGMMVMPLITEAGLGFGGGYGRGALRVGGVSVGYYSAAKANVGLQIGANQYAHVLFFMTEDALIDFRTSEGWSAGADMDVAFLGEGETLSADTSTALSPVVGIIFGQAGLRLGATLEGTKYTPLRIE